MVKVILSLYGFFLLAGAYFGYKAGSTVSLVMGLISGILVLIGIYLTGTHPTFGYKMIFFVSIILSIVFLIRLFKTHSFMPAGMLLILSLIALIICSLMSCAHQEVLLDQEPEYVPPELPIVTQPEEAVSALKEERRKEVVCSIADGLFSGLIGAALSKAIGSDDEGREKRWKRSRKRKILVKKGYIDKDASAPPEGFPSQYGF